MPFDVAVFPEVRYGVARLSGTVSGDDILGGGEALAMHADWGRDFTAVWDASQMESLDFGLLDLDRVLKQERQHRGLGERGEILVIANDTIWLSLLTLFEKMLRDDRRPLHVVPTREAAATHLGVSTLYEPSA